VTKKRSNKKKRKVVAQVVVPPDAAEVHVAIVLPAPPATPPNLSWQTKGKRLAIRIKNLMVKEFTP